jgi:hypothetical protein
MKKVFGLLIVLIFVFLIVSFFIPVRLEKKTLYCQYLPQYRRFYLQPGDVDALGTFGQPGLAAGLLFLSIQQ